MKKIKMILMIGMPLLLVLTFMSCSDWVTEVDPLSSQVEDGDLDS